MRQFRPIRLFALGLAAASLVGVGLATPAGAATAATCTKATFKTDLTKFTSTSQVTGCTKGPATAMTITATFKKLTNIQTKVTWKSGGGTNGPFKVTQKQVKGGAKGNTCKSETVKGKKTQNTMIISSAKVTTGTGKAKSLIGTKFSETLCVTNATTTYLAPKTKITV